MPACTRWLLGCLAFLCIASLGLLAGPACSPTENPVDPAVQLEGVPDVAENPAETTETELEDNNSSGFAEQTMALAGNPAASGFSKSAPLMERCQRRVIKNVILTICSLAPATGDLLQDQTFRQTLDSHQDWALTVYTSLLQAAPTAGGGAPNLDSIDAQAKGYFAVAPETYPATFTMGENRATVMHFGDSTPMYIPPRGTSVPCPGYCHGAPSYEHWYNDAWVGNWDPFWSFERWWQRSKALVNAAHTLPVTTVVGLTIWQAVDILTLTGLSTTSDAVVNWQECERNPGPHGCLKEAGSSFVNALFLSAFFLQGARLAGVALNGSKTAAGNAVVNGLRYEAGLAYSDDLYRGAMQLSTEAMPVNGVIVPFSKGSGTFFVSRDATGKIIGALQVDSAGYTYMVVSPTMQRQGIGTLLMQDAVNHAKNNGMQALYGQVIRGSASETILLRQGFTIFRTTNDRIIYVLYVK